MTAAGVEFVTAPRTEPYGRVAVFTDIAGNRWDLLGPAPQVGVNSRETFHYIAETVMLLITCKMRGDVTRGQLWEATMSTESEDGEVAVRPVADTGDEYAAFKIEQRGIDLIPDAEKKMKPTGLFWLWAGGVFNVEFLFYGTLIMTFGLSVPQAIRRSWSAT